MQDEDLDQLLALAAKNSPQPSKAFMDRILSDAIRAQPLDSTATLSVRPKPRLGLLAQLAAAFGGRPMLAGVASAAVFGLALGYSNPGAISMLTGDPVSSFEQSLDLLPETDFLTSEG